MTLSKFSKQTLVAAFVVAIAGATSLTTRAQDAPKSHANSSAPLASASKTEAPRQRPTRFRSRQSPMKPAVSMKKASMTNSICFTCIAVSKRSARP